jgi:hypothetical protein
LAAAPANIVVLVNESGNLSDDDLERERDAASTLALNELSAKSVVSVVGFGSDDVSGSAVDVVCPPTRLSVPTERERIARCIQDLRRRSPVQGDGADHVQALQEALRLLGSADGPKLVFLLTDGKLDVTDSPRYGPDPAKRADAARTALTQALATAKAEGVQISPLGFGAVDNAALAQLSVGGLRQSCGSDKQVPSRSVGSGSADVTAVLRRTFIAAQCAPQGSRLETGTSLEIPVTVPSGAADASIVVDKGWNGVAADFVDPNGRTVPMSGPLGFQVIVDNGSYLVLRVGEAEPGTWKVRFSSPAGAPAVRVSARFSWERAVSLEIGVDQPYPASGQQVNVTLRPLIAGEPVDTPELWRDFTFTAYLTGQVARPAATTLHDSGTWPDADAGDGIFAGQLTIPPDLTGLVKVGGRIDGRGFASVTDTQILVNTGGPDITLTVTLPSNETVAPGQLLSRIVNVNNNGPMRRARFQLSTDGPSAANIRMPDIVREIPLGLTMVALPLQFDSHAPEEVVSVILRVVDDTDPSLELSALQLTFHVAKPPPGYPWYQVILICLAVVTVLAVALFIVRRRRVRHGDEWWLWIRR